MRREGTPAWMQVVDRVWNKRSRRPVAARRKPESTAPSFRRKPESSGLDQPCPRSGHDHGHDNRTRASDKICHPSTSRHPRLDSGVRRNDNGGGNQDMPLTGRRRKDYAFCPVKPSQMTTDFIDR